MMVVKFDGHEEEAFDVDNATFTNVIVILSMSMPSSILSKRGHRFF